MALYVDERGVVHTSPAAALGDRGRALKSVKTPPVSSRPGFQFCVTCGCHFHESQFSSHRARCQPTVPTVTSSRRPTRMSAKPPRKSVRLPAQQISCTTCGVGVNPENMARHIRKNHSSRPDLTSAPVPQVRSPKHGIAAVRPSVVQAGFQATSKITASAPRPRPPATHSQTTDKGNERAANPVTADHSSAFRCKRCPRRTFASKDALTKHLQMHVAPGIAPDLSPGVGHRESGGPRTSQGSRHNSTRSGWLNQSSSRVPSRRWAPSPVNLPQTFVSGRRERWKRIVDDALDADARRHGDRRLDGPDFLPSRQLDGRWVSPPIRPDHGEDSFGNEDLGSPIFD